MIYWLDDEDVGVGYTDKEVAAKLRHLHEVNAELVEALKKVRIFVSSQEKVKHPEGVAWYDEIIAKATGETE